MFFLKYFKGAPKNTSFTPPRGVRGYIATGYKVSYVTGGNGGAYDPPLQIIF